MGELLDDTAFFVVESIAGKVVLVCTPKVNGLKTFEISFFSNGRKIRTAAPN